MNLFKRKKKLYILEIRDTKPQLIQFQFQVVLFQYMKIQILGVIFLFFFPLWLLAHNRTNVNYHGWLALERRLGSADVGVNSVNIMATQNRIKSKQGLMKRGARREGRK